MARKRSKNFIDLDSTQDSYGVDIEDMSISPSDSESNGFEDSEVQCSGELESIQVAAYKQVLKNYHELKVLKRNLAKTITHEEAKKHNSVRRPKEVFTRFCVSNFSSVLEALTPHDREVIENSGLGSLMLFQKCFVPNKFMKWVAQLVNYRSAEIVFDGKVISLTKESVHLVLGLPMGDKAFPSDPSGGKAFVLSLFEKQTIPSVTFFSNKIIKHQTQSDEELIISFVLVAMSSFLCSNSSNIPCYRYFGIFEDLTNLKQYDWCGYILDWLLDSVKSFNRGKSISSGSGGTLGVCLYYLAVMYLDYVDFGVRQVSDSIPRISVWKDGMIQTYADYDMKSPGSYGYHPLLAVSHTCYSKDLRFLYNPLCLSMDPDFTEKLQEVSGCKLPESLKANICKLIQNFCFNCGVTVNLDVNHITAMPDGLKSVFSEDFGSHPDNATSSQHTNVHGDDEELNTSDVGTDVPCSQYHVHKAKNPYSPIPQLNLSQFNSLPSGTSDSAHDAYKSSVPLPVPKLHRPSANFTPNVANDDIAQVIEKLTKNHSSNSSASNKTPSKFVMPLSGYPSNFSPSLRPGMSRFFSQQARSDKENMSPSFSQRNPIVMQTLEFTPHTTQRNSSAMSQSVRNSSSRFNSQSAANHSPIVDPVSDDLKIVGERSLADSVRDMSKKSDKMYNLKLQNSGVRVSTPQVFCSLSSQPSDANPSQSFSFRARASSTGDKLPIHGPRHLVKPGPLFKGDFVTSSNTNKIHISKSEIDNYNIILKLASSQYQCEDAVNLSGVRCTFWAFGESLKPGGVVKSFLVSAFAYSLFSKPNGHPNNSKSHYFFSNISEQFMKDLDDADEDVLDCAFRRSSKL
ncbi:hypothetical protein C2845_PM09G11560 [Panicum miliaceum]|uniref:Aminotransferase-like plant mobile domain-containing protein n=1 Tax=Panicum miliaceum TaxID=4540 RepID=A0A3L6S040_PANMI|nr:hypothetical protein C2845_PM09G11560 [Panicum miliaceum]